MFFKKDPTEVTLGESNLDNAINQQLAETSMPLSNSSCLSYMNSHFSFSDLTCCACFSLVPIFGMAGLGIGFAISSAFLKKGTEEHFNWTGDMILAALPFLGMFAFMFLGYLAWGKIVDWSMEWEVGTAQRRAQGLLATCLELFSCSSLNAEQSKDAENVLLESVHSEDTEGSLTIRFG